MITAWRLLKARYAAHAFDGEGARLYGGRWSSPGVAMTYCSATASLAVLEVVANVQRSDLLLAHYVLISCSIDPALVTRVELDQLPANWRESPAPAALKVIGDNWIRAAASAVLEVPSAIIGHERKYLLNPRHVDVARIVRSSPAPFSFNRLVK